MHSVLQLVLWTSGGCSWWLRLMCVCLQAVMVVAKYG
jgi:hypothetical protein